jgi:hypothetical protein
MLMMSVFVSVSLDCANAVNDVNARDPAITASRDAFSAVLPMF